MCLRLVLLSILLSALAANPCFAKNGHAQHGARASTANSGTSGKSVGGAKPPANAKAFIDTGEAVAPPGLPPRAQDMRTRNPSVKIVIPVNPSRSQTAASPAPVRNAIGQSVSSPRNFVGPQSTVSSSALRRPGAGSLPIIHGVGKGSVASVVPSATARVTLANAPNRGSINGSSVIHPATAPSIIGGQAAARYGINGTTVQQKH